MRIAGSLEEVEKSGYDQSFAMYVEEEIQRQEARYENELKRDMLEETRSKKSSQEKLKKLNQTNDEQSLTR